MTLFDTRRELKEITGCETPVPPLSGRRIHELFETLAALVPGTPSVAAEGETLTYGELDRRANRLARFLRSLGLGTQERVAVALERSPEAVVALLGVWKAGGAWIPLDLSRPAERLGLSLEESGATFLIAREESAAALAAAAPPWPLQDIGRLPPLWQLRIVRLDRDAAEIAGQSAAPVRSAAGPEQLAYIVLDPVPDPTGAEPLERLGMTHRDLVRRALGLACLPGGRPGTDHRVLHLTPGRALSLEEILLTLPQGAALHLAPPERLLGEACGRLLEERGITHLLLPKEPGRALASHLAALQSLDLEIVPGHPRTLVSGPAVQTLSGLLRTPAEPGIRDPG
ncbi:MAG TPA: AMP-binding protein [Thermoanaerobaculia bacterium]|nr:AMP-binding protein [Thermoanaerobaculia bacterium]